MNFCEICGARIVKYVRKDGKLYGLCRKNHLTPIQSGEVKKNVSINIDAGEPSIVIIDQKSDDMPLRGVRCPYCGGEVILLTSFVLWGDEDTVHLCKCLKCKRNFRVGAGVSGR